MIAIHPVLRQFDLNLSRINSNLTRDNCQPEIKCCVWVLFKLARLVGAYVMTKYQLPKQECRRFSQSQAHPNPHVAPQVIRFHGTITCYNIMPYHLHVGELWPTLAWPFPVESRQDPYISCILSQGGKNWSLFPYSFCKSPCRNWSFLKECIIKLKKNPIIQNRWRKK